MWTSNEPISQIECKKYTDKIKRSDNSLIQLRTNVWSDKSSQAEAKYTWCCRSLNTMQTRIIIKQFNAAINFVTKLMSANVNLESCRDIEKQYCVTETATVIWNVKIQEECKCARGKKVIGEKSGSVIVSEQDELVVNIIGKVIACKTKMWKTQEDLLIIINNVTNIIHPTAHENIFFHESGQSIHLNSKLVFSFVTHQLKDLPYNLFLRAYT